MNEITNQLPDIPRLYTGIAEWSAVVVYVFVAGARFRGFRTYALLAAALPALIGLQLILGGLRIELWTIGMVTAATTMWALIFLCGSTRKRDAVYLAARAFILAEFVQSLQWQLWVYWYKEESAPEAWTSAYFLGLAFLLFAYAAAFGLAYFAERRNFPSGTWAGIDTYSVAMAVAIAALAFAFSNMSFMFPGTIFTGSSGQDVFNIRTLVAFIGFVALYVQQSRRNHLYAVNELAQTQLIMESQHSQYLQSKRNIDDLNRMHHDLKYYVQAIRQEESADRREEYLTRLESTVRGYESEIRTGHAPIDIILSTHMSRCVREDIAMTTMVDGAALKFMDLMSLSTLFGNALDNAIEASRRIKDHEQRIIKITAFNRHDFVIITIENHWPFNVEFVEGIPQTTKADRARHGFGSRSIRRIAEEYQGSATFANENGWFAVRILIPRPAQAR